MGSRVSDRDNGYRATLKRYSAMGGRAQVGIPDDGRMHPSGEITLAALGAIHEFGLGVPERSWLRAWFDENQQKLRQSIKVVEELVAKGVITQEQGLEKLADRWVKEIQRRFVNPRIPPPLALSTTVAKQRSGSPTPFTPLMDTDALRQAITYIITAKGGSAKSAPTKTVSGGRARGRRSARSR